MIAALNLIPLALLALAAWAVWKKSRAGLIGVVLLAAVYAVVQPSYLPKGTVERSPVPAYGTGPRYRDRDRDGIPDRFDRHPGRYDRHPHPGRPGPYGGPPGPGRHGHHPHRP